MELLLLYDLIYVACKNKICNVIIRVVPEAEYGTDNGLKKNNAQGIILPEYSAEADTVWCLLDNR